MTFSEFYSNKIIEILTNQSAGKTNQIFVLLGQTELIDKTNFFDNITDVETFHLNGNEDLFDKNWFTNVFTKLNSEKQFHLLSFAQFSYLINYIDSSFFKDRVTIIQDNLRQLFPINKNEYLEEISDENIEIRPEKIPIYQAEQIQIKDYFFYSVKTLNDDFTTINLFEETTKLIESDNSDFDSIDISSDQTALDFFLNSCILENNLQKKAIVKIYSKQPINSSIIKNVEKVNYVLNLFGGSLNLLKEEIIKEDYQVNQSTKDLLLKYWGQKAEFRGLKVYRNPDIGNQVSEISQGLIVETIIKEYENSKRNEKTRDLFLTAPTGAGKSLLFQLPAFYVSQSGDITIVISPLIALMKDQVNAIITDRNFDKVAYLNSELSLIDREKIIENCQSGEIDILYMSPELFMSYDIKHFIGERKLGLLVIDEAHLITTWGRDFRVDYWFLGNHVRKVRKYHNLSFPMVAVTATAIYGGANDMVFDSIDSLVMHNPHVFIGQVKRSDITFAVNNHDRFSANYESNKLAQTVDFIKKINEVGLKTLVYTPYTKHIRQIIDKLNNDNLEIATGYYGAMSAQQKEFSFRQFKSGQKKIMISTKAFGMGVDISDIELVYHHAPSGLLPDYVQEIGRVARNPEIKGFAALNYSSQDQRFTRALHGMSALRQYQIKEVLKKIHKAYIKNNKSRNLLLSVDDFGHIFENALDLDQKVLTALMMIEKDYLAKNRFNVLIARPKKLFVRVFARISDQHLSIYRAKYSETFTHISSLENGNNIIEIDLDKLWYQKFNDKSFPIVKRDFYTGYLFRNDGIEVIPQLKISYERLEKFNILHQKIGNFFVLLTELFVSFNGKYFSQNELETELKIILNDDVKAEKISKFILSSYSGRLIQPSVVENGGFLQQKKEVNGYKYRIINNRYLENFAALTNRLNNLFGNTDEYIVNRYVTNKESNSINYVRLGYFLEMLELGTFEIKGGENPMVFIRINDPLRIERDSNNNSYNNTLLSKTLERHHLSNQIFDHFFLRSFSNDERWDFVEDFFLGSDVDVLLDKHKGGEANNLNIIEFLDNNSTPIKAVATELDEKNNIHIFHPNSESFYNSTSLLTIDNEQEIRTMKISEWLSNDPVAFDKVRKEFNLKIDSKIFEILVSRLKNHHFEYFKNSLGLNMRIDFKGYDTPVKASIPYKDKPLEFYKWWCNNKNQVTMNFREKLILFDKVFMQKPKVLKAEHRKILDK
ncbi:helicase-related protein [Riemerella anatipestifer]|nr:helicase-related protein [Riemerella anatipestifer]MDY3326128.1 helicase-related protein [Riemerella anatipestifer]MDY3354478.1 helicase-related protein [Riemerella anatipestifer]